MRRPPSLCVPSLLILVALLLSSTPGPSPPPAGAVRLAVGAQSGPTPAHGNFSLRLPGPTGIAYPGSLLRVEYYVTVLGGPPGPLTIFVPPTQVLFSVTPGLVAGNAAPWNFTVPSVTAGAPVRSEEANVTAPVLNQSSFNGSSAGAIFSTLSVALASSAPYGSVNLTVTWRWLSAGPDGIVVASPWSSSPPIVPAQVATLRSAGPPVVNPGGSYSVCLTGPVGGRTFSLHLLVNRPFDDFVQTEAAAAPGSAGPLCWAASVPGWVPPGPLLAEVWSYGAVTHLLYLLKFTLLAAAPPPAWLAAIEAPGTAISLACLALLPVAIGIASRRRRPPANPRADPEATDAVSTEERT